MKRTMIAAGVSVAAGICFADPIATVAEFTNAIATASSGSTIELAAGVTFDFSTLEEYSEGTSWGTMSAPDANGISCVWWQKKLTIKGADDTAWDAKTSSQETIVSGGDVARIFYGYAGSGRKSTFQNLTFVNGTAPSGKNGGAILFGNSESTGGATNCVFRNCSATKGGATFSVPVYGSLFESCSATSYGGGAYCDRNYCIMSGNVYRGCTAQNGGAAYLQNMTTSPAGRFADCVVSNCTASSNGGGLYVVSGGVSNTVSNCLFRANSASSQGGGMYQGTATKCVFDSNESSSQGGGCSVTVADRCSFVGNSSTSNRGGAMYMGSAVGCGFTNNTCAAAARGGACDKVDAVDCVFSGKGDVSCGRYVRCVFDGVVSDGGKVWVFDALANNGETLGATNCLVVNCEVGRLVNVSGQSASFANCTFADNTIVDAGYSVYCSELTVSSTLYDGAGIFVNCLFSGNRYANESGADMILFKSSDSDGNTLEFSNCLYTDGLDNDAADVFANIVHSAAHFVAGNADYSECPYYSLLRKSSARNAGANAAWMSSSIDLAGNDRIFDNTVDIGCYECAILPQGIVFTVR